MHVKQNYRRRLPNPNSWRTVFKFCPAVHNLAQLIHQINLTKLIKMRIQRKYAQPTIPLWLFKMYRLAQGLDNSSLTDEWTETTEAVGTLFSREALPVVFKTRKLSKTEEKYFYFEKRELTKIFGEWNHSWDSLCRLITSLLNNSSGHIKKSSKCHWQKQDMGKSADGIRLWININSGRVKFGRSCFWQIIFWRLKFSCRIRPRRTSQISEKIKNRNYCFKMSSKEQIEAVGRSVLERERIPAAQRCSDNQ